MSYLLNTQAFTFKAQTVTPFNGNIRQLTSTAYQVIVKKDTVIVDLPYFGRAYAASVTGDAGIRFNSSHFSYTVNLSRRKRWEVIIRPSDADDVNQLFFTVFENGSAVLQVTSNNRQPISFNGYIVK